MLPTVMNPTSTDPTAPPAPPPPRSSFSCDRHPAEQFTGFCPSCLCERLTTLDNSSSNTPSSSRRPSSASAAAAIKALFSSTSKPTNFAPPPPPSKLSKQPPSFPELRRTKSFSASKNEALGQFFEPQRKSCDVRVRNTLWTLFTLDDESKVCGGDKPSFVGAAAASSSHQNSKKTGSFDKPFLEETENLESGDDDDDDVGGSEIRSLRESHFENSRNAVEFEVNNDGITEEATAREGNLKIKDHIDVDNNQEKKSSGFWAAASVFSKKWQEWRRKPKTKKQNTLPVEKQTQSEIADYGYGRRSCDTDPRFSLDDAAARCSFDEPGASWDGYLMGRSFPRMVNEGPGGTVQTREYYSDSSCRRRKSVDRCSSSSITKKVVGEVDELKMVSNAKVSPTTADCYHGARELRDEYSNSLIGNGERKEEIKKARRWSWRLWGFKFIHRRNKQEEEEEEEEYSSSRVNRVGRSMSVRSEVNINMLNSHSNSRNGGSTRKLERNRSARCSSLKHKNSNSIARSVLRLY